MMRELYRLAGFLGIHYESEYYDHIVRIDIAKASVIVMMWLHQHGALQALMEDCLKSLQQLFPQNTDLIEYRNVSFNAIIVPRDLLRRLIQHAIRISIMATFFTVMQTTTIPDDMPWEWVRGMYLDAMVEKCKSEQTIHKVLFRMHDICKRYTHMA